jgi:hypothetical protein
MGILGFLLLREPGGHSRIQYHEKHWITYLHLELLLFIVEYGTESTISLSLAFCRAASARHARVTSPFGPG